MPFDFRYSIFNLGLIKSQNLIIVNVAEDLVIEALIAIQALTVTKSVEPEATLISPVHSNHPTFIFFHGDVPLYYYLEPLRFQYL